MIEERRSGHVLAAVVLSASLLLQSAPAGAQACALPEVDNAEEAISGIDGLLLDQCLGGSSCETEECAAVAQLTDAPDLPEDQLAER